MRIFYLIRQLQLAGYRGIEPELRCYRITPAQYMALSILHPRASNLSSAELSRRLGVSAQATNEIVVALEAKGFIMRAGAPASRRILHIGLTARGRKLFDACDRAVEKVETLFFRRLSRRQQLTLQRLLTTTMADVVARSRAARAYRDGGSEGRRGSAADRRTRAAAGEGARSKRPKPRHAGKAEQSRRTYRI